MQIIRMDDFDGYVGKLVLASDSRTERRLTMISMPLLNAHYYEVQKGTRTIARFTLDKFQAAIEAYNGAK